MASLGVKVIRSVFGATERFAPGLAGRLAFELFCRTPSRNSLSDGERRAIGRAESFMAEARHHRLKTPSGCVAVHEFRPEERTDRGTVLVIHGWRSRTEYMQAIIAGHRAAGFRVVSLDLPGHGHSLGRRLNMAVAVEAARTAGEWFGPFAAIVGHSFGGAVAVNAAVGSIRGISPVVAQRLVLIAAPNSMPAVFEDFGRYVNLGPRSRVAIADQVKRVAGRPLSDFVSSSQLARMPIPTLVIHAPDDREVPAENAKQMVEAGDHVELRWTPGLGHRRILSDAGVVDASVSFVARSREPALLH